MSRTTALSLLSVAMALAMTTWFSASAVLPELRLRWSLSSGESAWLTIAVQLGFVFGALLSAVTNLPDQVSPRLVVFGCAIGAAIVNALVASADGFASALPLRFATGMFAAGIYPPMLKILATHFREGRGLALGILVGALTLGNATPHLVHGIGTLPWQQVVLVSSFLTVIGGAVALLVPNGMYPFARGSFEPRYALRAFRDPAVRLANFGYFGHMWELFAMWTWFAAFFAASLAAAGVADASSLASLGAFAVVGAGAIGCIAGGVLGDAWGRTRTTALAMTVSASCAALIGAAFASPALVFVVGLVWGVAVVADSAQFSTMVTELADQAYVGTALTVQLAAGFALTAATIWLVPLVRDAIGWPLTFLLLVPGPALGVVAMLRLRDRPESQRIAGGRG
ncbi:MAG: MFS transporter [Chloroflexi bacterium]|nr:MAG: MFS transporter [Chloroflexota bacterium]